MRTGITLKQTIEMRELEEILRTIPFRGLYGNDGQKVRPYENAKFSLVKVFPAKSLGGTPEIKVGSKTAPLFTAQPTIYQNQLEIFSTVDRFLQGHKLDISSLRGAIEYSWEGRGDFHMLPPIVEKHTYHLNRGYIDLDKLCARFNGTYVKDARGNLHHLGGYDMHSFFIDEVSKLNHMTLFNSNAPVINYGLQYSGSQTFHIVCDGSHRLDYVLEELNKPITVILVESKSSDSPLYPYYAFPVPLRPTIRLSSKKAEIMYHRLERDKIHLLNDFIRKVLHYEWEAAGLLVGKLRSNVDIY